MLPGRLASAQGLVPQRLLVRQLKFEGNHAIDDYTLGISIATSISSKLARWWLTRWLHIGERKYLDETEFRRDVLRILLLYRVSGFLQAHVDTVVRRTADAAFIRLIISEGEPVRVRSIDINGGEGIVAKRELLRDIPIAVGDPFNRIRFEWAADTIRTAVKDQGYPFAEIFRSYDVREDSLTARIAFEIQPGNRARVDSVSVSGTRQMDPQVVRRMMPLREGDWFSQSALYQSQRDLYRLGAFGYVTVGLADSTPSGPADSTVAIRVQVAEGRLHRVRTGVGYGTVDCFRALGGWSATNALGGGRVLDLTARLSKIGASDVLSGLERTRLCRDLAPEVGTRRFRLNFNVTASFQQPFLFSRLNRATLSVSAEQHSEINAYLRRAIGANLAFTRQTRWNVPVTASYSVSLTQTLAESAVFCSFLNVCDSVDVDQFGRQRVQSMVGLAFVRDRANSALDPTRGTVLSADARYASRALGSDPLIQFARGVVEFASYHPIGRRAAFAWRVRYGTIVSPRLSLTGQSIQYVPPAERFYAGGPNSVRGYAQNELGPVVRVVNPERIDTVITPNPQDRSLSDTTLVPDTLTSAKGGNSLLIANAELRFPLPVFAGRVSGALFLDVGHLIERQGELVDLAAFRATPGAGIRITTPIGPLRLDVAYNGYLPERGQLYLKEGQNLRLLDPQYQPSAGRHFRLHFSVGQAF